jgi:GntR family transcriptional regulator
VLLHVAFDQRGKAIEVAQAVWPGPVTQLTEKYPIAGERPALPVDDPDLALG